MPSPFPGMDPYLEGEEWTDFHTTFNTVMRELLNELLDPHYTVRVEKRVYLELEDDARAQQVSDNLLFKHLNTPGRFSGGGAATLERPIAEAVPATVPVEVERRETFLTVRNLPGRKVVAVIETLSPSNKRPGRRGREVYLRKRQEILNGPAHLLEIDLLRGGERPPLGGNVPQSTYRAVISRAERRPRCDVFPCDLAEPLPTLPVPLSVEDGPAPLELQKAFRMVYERARYDRTLDYAAPPEVPFSPAEATFARTLPGVLTSIEAHSAAIR